MIRAKWVCHVEMMSKKKNVKDLDCIHNYGEGHGQMTIVKSYVKDLLKSNATSSPKR